jgi:DNA-directed RNA polymerase II subunit RPB1
MDEYLFENMLFSELNVARDDVGKLIQSNNNSDNCVTVMHQSGSKGDANNTGQMSGCIGLQSVEGKLPQKKINNRTIPYFHENDDTAVARGLVKQSFLKGTRFPEFFFINMASREGLISSAVLTAESGYIQRKLIKSMEDAMIKYDKTVRGANNGILQFIYGDAGSDTIKQYEHTIKLIEMGNTDIMKKYCFSDEELKNYIYKLYLQRLPYYEAADLSIAAEGEEDILKVIIEAVDQLKF